MYIKVSAPVSHSHYFIYIHLYPFWIHINYFFQLLQDFFLLIHYCYTTIYYYYLTLTFLVTFITLQVRLRYKNLASAVLLFTTFIVIYVIMTLSYV